MTANRGVVALIAAAVLVWGVAFGGGVTVAVLTSAVDVTTTFETEETFNADGGGDDATAASPPAEAARNATGATRNETPPTNETANQSANQSVPASLTTASERSGPEALATTAGDDARRLPPASGVRIASGA